MDIKLPLLLDGATGSNLIAAGMPSGICVEKWILDHKSVLADLQREYVNAGSQVVYAPTFGANSAALKHYGLENNVAKLNQELCELSKSAVGDKAMIAGNLSPTGLFIEPFGDSSFEDIVDIYTEQVSALIDSDVDLIICETLSVLSDIRAAVIAASKYDKPIFVTVTIDENGKTMSGMTPLCALILLQELGVAAFGVNCSNGPNGMVETVKQLVNYSKIPIIAKPNASLPSKVLTTDEFAKGCEELLKAGVKIIGGCCGTTPEHIKKLSPLIKNYENYNLPEPEEVLAATSDREVYFLDPDNLIFSEPIECGFSLADNLIDIEDSGANIALVQVTTIEDAYNLSENAHMARLPVAIQTDSPSVLEAALRNFQGRAIVYTKSEMHPEAIRIVADKYGAIVY